MLTVKTYLAPSKVHGIGLYAGEDIPAHTLIWKFNSFVDRMMAGNDFYNICKEASDCTLQHILTSTYKRGGKFFYLTDNARFINHSEQASNIAFINDYTEMASRDIKYGEELLENYNLSYDANDFFFTENITPDPYHYFLEECRCPHAESKNLS